MYINFLISLFVFIFGVCIGSFVNCLIYRLEQNKSIMGRSFCPNCKHSLEWRDLIPIFSFLFLNGKCRYCDKKISYQYPVVEIATGITFLLVYLFQASGFKFQDIFALIFWFYIASSLIIIFIYDLKHYIIPDRVLIPAIIITAIYDIILVSFKFQISSLMNYFWAVLVSAGLFLVIFLMSRGKAMGFGDVKLAVLMGLLLGLPNILLALFLAFFFGAIIGLMLMVFEGKTLKSEIPFGPFLITGTFIAILWGTNIINWYINFFII